MYTENSDITTPPDETSLWRYIDLGKFINLLTTSSLYLPRLDCLRDRWEGVWPAEVIESVQRNWTPSSSSTFLEIADRMRASAFVSCWHASSHESAALWDQYGPSGGLAIRSSVGRIKRSAHDKRAYFIGAVTYVGYKQPDHGHRYLNALSPLFLKRKSFEHEREVRLLYWDRSPEKNKKPPRESPRGVRLGVDLATLMEALYISPTAPTWIDDPIREVATRFGLRELVVKRSDLYDEHLY